MPAFRSPILHPSAEPLLLLQPDGELGTAFEERDPSVRRRVEVTPNILGIARRPDRVAVPLLDGRGEIVFDQVRFESREGFAIEERTDAVIPSPDASKLVYYWYGRSGVRHLFLLIERGERIQALVYGPGIRIALNSGNRLRPVLRELDANLVDREACVSRLVAASRQSLDTTAVLSSIAASPRKLRDAAAGAGRPTQRVAEIGTLIHYTEKAAAARGGVANLQRYADFLIEQANTAKQKSGETWFVRFVRIGELRSAPLRAYLNPLVPSEGNAIDDERTADGPFGARIDGAFLRFPGHLEALSFSDLGPLEPPNLHGAGADLAMLLVDDRGNPDPTRIRDDSVFGVSFIQRDICTSVSDICGFGPQFRPFAYAVVSSNVGAQNLTFAHELGHLLGNDHDINAESSQPFPRAFAFANGHRVTGLARDIIADPACLDLRPRSGRDLRMHAGSSTPVFEPWSQLLGHVNAVRLAEPRRRPDDDLPRCRQRGCLPGER